MSLQSSSVTFAWKWEFWWGNSNNFHFSRENLMALILQIFDVKILQQNILKTHFLLGSLRTKFKETTLIVYDHYLIMVIYFVSNINVLFKAYCYLSCDFVSRGVWRIWETLDDLQRKCWACTPRKRVRTAWNTFWQFEPVRYPWAVLRNFLKASQKLILNQSVCERTSLQMPIPQLGWWTNVPMQFQSKNLVKKIFDLFFWLANQSKTQEELTFKVL